MMIKERNIFSCNPLISCFPLVASDHLFWSNSEFFASRLEKSMFLSIFPFLVLNSEFIIILYLFSIWFEYIWRHFLFLDLWLESIGISKHQLFTVILFDENMSKGRSYDHLVWIGYFHPIFYTFYSFSLLALLMLHKLCFSKQLSESSFT